MLNENGSPTSPGGEAPRSGAPDRDTRSAEPNPSSAPATGKRDLSKISLVISLLSLVLVTIFFFGLNRNLSGLSREVQGYDGMKNSVATLDAYVDDILSQMGRINARLLDLDERQRTQVVRILMQTMLDEMLQKTDFLIKELGNAPEAAKLLQIQEMLRDLRRSGGASPTRSASPDSESQLPPAPSAAPENVAPDNVAPQSVAPDNVAPQAAPAPAEKGGQNVPAPGDELAPLPPSQSMVQ